MSCFSQKIKTGTSRCHWKVTSSSFSFIDSSKIQVDLSTHCDVLVQGGLCILWHDTWRPKYDHLLGGTSLATQKRPLLDNGLVSMFPWQQINTEKQNNTGTIRHGDLYSVCMKLAQLKIQTARRIQETRDSSRFIVRGFNSWSVNQIRFVTKQWLSKQTLKILFCVL
jgi:hypothetical protein